MELADGRKITLAALDLTVIGGWPVDARVEWLTARAGMPLERHRTGSVLLPLAPVGREQGLDELDSLLAPARIICWSPSLDLSRRARCHFEDRLALVTLRVLADRIAEAGGSHPSALLVQGALMQQNLRWASQQFGRLNGLGDGCTPELGLLSVGATILAAEGPSILGVAA